MFPVGEANFFIKKMDFGDTSTTKNQRRLGFILGGAALVTAGGIQLQSYNADNVGTEKQQRRKI